MRRMPLDNDDEPGPVTDNEISSFFASLDLSYSDVTELATRWFFRQRTVNLSAPLSDDGSADTRSEEHTSELQSLMRISYAVFCLKKKKKYTNQSPKNTNTRTNTIHNNVN